MAAAQLIGTLLAVLQGDTLTVSQVKADYALLFPCNSVITDSTIAYHRLGPFVEEIHFFQAYLRYGHPGRLLGTGCQERLRSDSVFNAIMLPAMRAYLRRRGGELVGVPDYRKRVIAWQDVMTVASRFFYVNRFLADGRVERYICGGKNRLADLPGPRDLALEAFAYAAIFRDLSSDHPRISGRCKAAIEAILAEAELPADTTSRIIRIRELLYDHMAQDPVLREVLAHYYARMAEYLPFVIEE